MGLERCWRGRGGGGDGVMGRVGWWDGGSGRGWKSCWFGKVGRVDGRFLGVICRGVEREGMVTDFKGWRWNRGCDFFVDWKYAFKSFH